MHFLKDTLEQIPLTSHTTARKAIKTDPILCIVIPCTFIYKYYGGKSSFAD